MKFNKWTVGLAAVGAISLASAARAEESTQMDVVNAMTSGTTISGYVSTSLRYDLNTATGPGVNSADAIGTGKANGFNLDVVNLTIEKPLDESEWAAGYKAELLFGDANDIAAVGATADTNIGIKQAYVNLRAPVGNGLELKMGLFDTIIGYEAYNYPANPNYTRSLGWAIEPTQHTGLLASYRISDIVSVVGGVAETANAPLNNRPSNTAANATKDQFNLTYMAAVSVTAPEDMGALAGSTLYAGVVYGRNVLNGGTGGNSANYYAGLTMATGVEGLSIGGAFDYQDWQDTAGAPPPTRTSGSQWVAGVYASFQATEKLSLHARGEYYRGNSGFAAAGTGNEQENWEGTLTAQYDLWQNVITRVEYRWDNRNNGAPFGDATGGTTLNNAHLLALNVIYQF